MSLSPVAFIAPNYRDYKEWWLKFYTPATTTPKSIFTDSSGAVSVAKLQLNADGFIVSAGGAIVTPYISGAYDAYLFRTEALADANDTTDAVRVADDIGGVLSDSIVVFDNIAEMKAAGLDIGQTATCKRFYADGDFIEGLLFNIVDSSAGTSDGGSFHSLDNGNLAELIYSAKVNVEQLGAKGDGVTDDTNAFRVAASITSEITAKNKSFLITDTVTFTNPIKIESPFTVIPDLGLGGGDVFYFTTDNVIIKNITFDATGRTFTPATGNTYILRSGDGTTKYKNHTFQDNTFINCNYSDGLSGTSNLLVTQVMYVDNVDNVTIDSNVVNSSTGAGVFVRDVTGLSCVNNELIDCVWYPIHLVGGVDTFDVSHNTIISNIVQGVFYGGAIDLMSQHIPKEKRNINGVVSNNYITGTMSYGAAIRALSLENVSIHSNNIIDIKIGTVSLSPTLTGIRIDTRGTVAGSENGPAKNVKVYGNKIVSGETSTNTHLGIYVSNQWQTARVPAQDIRIFDNEVLSVDSSNYFESGIIFQGNEGGIENVYVTGNRCTTLLQSGGVVDGAIGFVAPSTQGRIEYVRVGGNYVTDIGTPSASFQVAIGYGAFVDKVIQESPNTLDNFQYGVRTFTNAGPTLDRVDDNEYLNINLEDNLFGVSPSRFGKDLIAEVVYNPPSLGAGATTFTDVSVTGSSVGDVVQASFSNNQDGVIFTGYVRIATSVRVYLENKESTTKDLASGTLKVRVIK